MTEVPKHDPETNKNPANDSEGYEIGYGKPPKHTQRKKGECPNRKGRPRRRHAESCGDLSDRISNEKVTISENGRRVCIRKRQLLAKRIVDLGIAGHPEYENMLIRAEQPDLRPSASRQIVDVDSEDEIPTKLRELSRRKKHRSRGAAAAPAQFGRGRPRHDAPFSELIQRELNKQTEVQENGRTLRITKREFWMRRLWNDAINGNSRALRIYSKLAKPTDPPPEDSFFFIVGGR